MVDLPRPGGTRDEDEAFVQLTELQDGLGEPQLFSREDFARDDAEDASRATPVVERVGAKAREIGDLVREVGVVPLVELLAVPLGHDGREQFLHVLRRQWCSRRVERLHAAVLADHRRRADRQMQVGGAERTHRVEERVYDRRAVAHGVTTSVTSTTWAMLIR